MEATRQFYGNVALNPLNSLDQKKKIKFKTIRLTDKCSVLFEESNPVCRFCKLVTTVTELATYYEDQDLILCYSGILLH